MSSVAQYPRVAHQPVRLLYQLAWATTIALRLPLWLTVSLVPALRPHPQWTFRQTLLARIGRAAAHINGRVGITESVSLEPGPEGDRFQLLAPFPPETYQGPLLPQPPQAAPAPVGVTWYPAKPAPGAAAPKVALHIHGGAFVLGQSRPAYNGFAAAMLLEHAGFDAVLAVSYRLAGYAGMNPFPAALQDVLTSYLYLTRTLALSPAQIVLVGDSAGGNLVIGLLRYLEDFGHELALPSRGRPSGAMLVSPWVDPLAALGPDSVYTSNPHWRSDYLPVSFLQWGAKAYGGEALRGNPYVTPMGHPFATPVPLLVLIGEAELLLTEGLRWTEEMKRVSGNQVELHLEPGAAHDTFLVGNLLGWEKSIRKTMAKLAPSIAKMRQELPLSG